jgi:hypothetical protein
MPSQITPRSKCFKTVITLELWIWLLVDIYIIVSEYLGCVVITENVVFQHVYGEEHGRAAKAPDTVIFDPTVPVLEVSGQLLIVRNLLVISLLKSGGRIKLGSSSSSL